MPGFTRLENDSDLATLLALPSGLVKPYLYLLSRANLNDPGVTWDEVALACGLKRAQTFDALSGLAARGLVVRNNGLWQSRKPDSNSDTALVSSLQNRTTKKRRVQKTGLESPENRTESSGIPDSRVQKTGLEHVKNIVLDSENEGSKEVEQKRTEEEQKKDLHENTFASTPRSQSETPLENPTQIQSDPTPPNPTPRTKLREPKDPTTWQRMFGAVALACYGTDRNLEGRPLKLVATTAKALGAMHVQPEQVPEIRVWIAQNESWRQTVNPADLETAAPRWRAGMTSNATSTSSSRAPPTRPPTVNNLNDSDRWAQAEADQNEFLRSIGLNPDGTKNSIHDLTQSPSGETHV